MGFGEFFRPISPEVAQQRADALKLLASLRDLCPKINADDKFASYHSKTLMGHLMENTGGALNLDFIGLLNQPISEMLHVTERGSTDKLFIMSSGVYPKVIDVEFNKQTGKMKRAGLAFSSDLFFELKQKQYNEILPFRDQPFLNSLLRAMTDDLKEARKNWTNVLYTKRENYYSALELSMGINTRVEIEMLINKMAFAFPENDFLIAGLLPLKQRSSTIHLITTLPITQENARLIDSSYTPYSLPEHAVSFGIRNEFSTSGNGEYVVECSTGQRVSRLALKTADFVTLQYWIRPRGSQIMEMDFGKYLETSKSPLFDPDTQVVQLYSN